MKLLNKKNLQLNVQGTLPRSGFNTIPAQSGAQFSSSQMLIQQTPQTLGGQQTSLTQSAPSLMVYQQQILQQKLVFKDKLTKITEGLYLGNYLSAKDQKSLQQENITHIINCSPSDCPNMFESDITYLNINIQDNWKTNLFQVIYIILDFLKAALKQNGKVLIHCNQGISRSPSIVIAYLIYTEKINATQALEKLKKKYPYADPNLDFQIQLNEMYKEVVQEEEEQQRQRNSGLQVNSPQQTTYSFSPQNKSLLNKQVMNNSQHISISTPSSPSQTFTYNSYVQMQKQSNLYNNTLNQYTSNKNFNINGQIESQNKSNTQNKFFNQPYPSINIYNSQNSNDNVKMNMDSFIKNTNLSQSINLNGEHIDSIEEKQDQQPEYSSSSLQKSTIVAQNQDQQSFFNNQAPFPSNFNQTQVNTAQQQKQKIQFKHTESDDEDICLGSPTTNNVQNKSKYFLSKNIQKSEKNININKNKQQQLLQDKNQKQINPLQTQEILNLFSEKKYPTSQSLQMSNHSYQDQMCDESTEIFLKSPIPLKSTFSNYKQSINIEFDEKFYELKNKMTDSDIDPLDSTDIQDYNTDTSASFSFDISSNQKPNVKQYMMQAKTFNNHLLSASTSTSISSSYTSKFADIKNINNQSLNFPCPSP